MKNELCIAKTYYLHGLVLFEKMEYGESIVSLFQNIYYIFEAGMVVLLISLMQSAGEKWFKNASIPWGSIGLLITWGMGHLTHGALATFWICLTSLLLGIFYVLSKKSIWASYIFILLIFVI